MAKKNKEKIANACLEPLSLVSLLFIYILVEFCDSRPVHISMYVRIYRYTNYEQIGMYMYICCPLKVHMYVCVFQVHRREVKDNF